MAGLFSVFDCSHSFASSLRPDEACSARRSSSSTHPLQSGYAHSVAGARWGRRSDLFDSRRGPQAMRDAKRKNRRRRSARDVPEAEVVGADARPGPDAEALDLLKHGLRVLARLAVRAYFRHEASLSATDLAERCPDNPTEDCCHYLTRDGRLRKPAQGTVFQCNCEAAFSVAASSRASSGVRKMKQRLDSPA